MHCTAHLGAGLGYSRGFRAAEKTCFSLLGPVVAVTFSVPRKSQNCAVVDSSRSRTSCEVQSCYVFRMFLSDPSAWKADAQRLVRGHFDVTTFALSAFQKHRERSLWLEDVRLVDPPATPS